MVSNSSSKKLQKPKRLYCCLYCWFPIKKYTLSTPNRVGEKRERERERCIQLPRGIQEAKVVNDAFLRGVVALLENTEATWKTGIDTFERAIS